MELNIPFEIEQIDEPFDYTKWQENLFENMSIEEISKEAAEYRKKNTE